MSVLELIAMLGVAQSAVLLLLILTRYRNRRNLPLVFILFTLAVRLGSIPLWNYETLLVHPWMMVIFSPIPFLGGLEANTTLAGFTLIAVAWAMFVVSLWRSIVSPTSDGTEREKPVRDAA